MGATTSFKLSLLLSLLSVSLFGVRSGTLQNVGVIPSTCKSLECPNYDVIQVGNGYEIRRYNSTVWISNSPIQDISLVKATIAGFQRLFDYIQGNNIYKDKIEMTAPVFTEVLPSNGPSSESSFVVSLYVPKKNQPSPPPAKGLNVQRWKTVYAAVRQFGGFVSDSSVGKEAEALKASIAGTKWSAATVKSRRAVAQYNSPFEFFNRVNEIFFLFDVEKEMHAM